MIWNTTVKLSSDIKLKHLEIVLNVLWDSWGSYRSEKSTSLNVIEPIFSLSPLTAYFFQSLPYWRITLSEVAQSQTTSSYCCGHRTIRRLLPKFFSSPHHPWMCFSLIKRIIGYDRTNQTLNLLTALFYNSPFFCQITVTDNTSRTYWKATTKSAESKVLVWLSPLLLVSLQ